MADAFLSPHEQLKDVVFYSEELCWGFYSYLTYCSERGSNAKANTALWRSVEDHILRESHCISELIVVHLEQW